MKLPNIVAYYRGLPDEWPEDEHREWEFFGHDIRITEGIEYKYHNNIKQRTLQRITAGRVLWQKINAVPKITPR